MLLRILILIGLLASKTAFADPTFAGYSCTQDCSGHEAGYEWAQKHDIDNPDNCGGNSQSFIEGCMAYANGLSPDIEDDDSSADDNENNSDDNNDGDDSSEDGD